MVSYLAYPGLDQYGVSHKQMMSIARGVKGQNPKKILESVCEYYGQPVDRVISACRKREYAWCRHVFFYFCVQFTSMTKNQMAQYVGRKDHASVKNGQRDVQNILDTEPGKIKDLKDIQYLIMYGPTVGAKNHSHPNNSG